jgi:hypothetical protein
MTNYFAGIAVGIIILQTMVFAPTIFKTLEMEPAGKLLRALFPKFFRLLTVLGIITLVSLLLKEDTCWVAYLLGGLTVACPVICALLVPATNRATDAGEKRRFKFLHTVSVALTLVVLLSDIVLPFL